MNDADTPQRGTSGSAIAALAFGALSLLVAFSEALLGLPLSIAGAMCGLVGIFGRSRWPAAIGLLLSIGGFAVAVPIVGAFGYGTESPSAHAPVWTPEDEARRRKTDLAKERALAAVADAAGREIPRFWPRTMLFETDGTSRWYVHGVLEEGGASYWVRLRQGPNAAEPEIVCLVFNGVLLQGVEQPLEARLRRLMRANAVFESVLAGGLPVFEGSRLERGASYLSREDDRSAAQALDQAVTGLADYYRRLGARLRRAVDRAAQEAGLDLSALGVDMEADRPR